jgi:anti-anti-sigma factor
MEPLTKAGLDRLTAVLAERLEDPEPGTAAAVATAAGSDEGPAGGGYSLRRTVAHAVRGVEAYLQYAAESPGAAGVAASRARAEELWAVLERAAAGVHEGACLPGHARLPRKDRLMTQKQPMLRGAATNSRTPGTAVTTTRHGPALVVRVTGELDLNTARVLYVDPADLEGVSRLALDVEQLEFCDSSGLKAMLQLRREADERGVRFHLCAPGEQMRRLLELTGADEVIEVHASLAEVLTGLDAASRVAADD